MMDWKGWKYIMIIVKVGSIAFTLVEIIKLIKKLLTASAQTQPKARIKTPAIIAATEPSASPTT